MKSKTLIPIILAITISSFAFANEIVKKDYPVPETVSKEIAPFVTSDYPTYWNDHPQTKEEWSSWVEAIATSSKQNVVKLIEESGVTVNKIVENNVSIYVITPPQIAPINESKALLHIHGGGYVLNPGEAGLDEAIMMAANENIRVYSVDYRMPPNSPFPAAIDDSVSTYRYLLDHYPSSSIGVFGTSTGGGLTFALTLELKRLNLPLPAALMVGTPWTDMDKIGDSYYTHEGLDNVLVSYDGWLKSAALLYANGEDLKNPLLSPINGDLSGFPPTILFTGTRDLFLSNTIRMHLKLREEGNIADLIVFEGLSHAQYLFNAKAPESKRYFDESIQFFHKYAK